jgi:hypothetical protein
MSEFETGPAQRELVERTSHTPFNEAAEKVRDPIEKLRNIQAAFITVQESLEIIHQTSIPDLEAMALQSTADVTALLRSRLDNPLPGPNQVISFMELGPRDDELDGLAEAHDALHNLFLRMYHHEAWLDYQSKVAFERKSQTMEEYRVGQKAYADDVAKERLAAICPPIDEIHDQVFENWASSEG